MNIEQSPTIMVGILGLGMLQIIGLYEQTAPSLQELRSAPPFDDTARQQLMDANIIVGVTTVVVAAMATIVTQSVWPLVFYLGGLGMVALWHYLVMTGETF